MRRRLRHRARQAGAALLAAMLTVALVAAFAAAALWQQWRAVEIEAAERARLQSAWILTGALDWARLILREDARSGGADHLAEPWAVPLQEARLSTFLAANEGVATVETAGNDTQDDCTRERSAISTSTLRHCCHMAAAAKVATSVTVSMAASRAAPRERVRRALTTCLR